MRGIKKATALALTAAMAMSLAGCGRNAGNAGKAQAPAAGSGESTAELQGDRTAQVTIKIGHVEAEDRSTHQALEQYRRWRKSRAVQPGWRFIRTAPWAEIPS